MINENEQLMLHFIANKLCQEQLMCKVDNIDNPLQDAPTSEEMFFLRVAIDTIANIENVNKNLMLQLLSSSENLRELLKYTKHHTLYVDKEKGLVLLPGPQEEHQGLSFYKYLGQMDIVEAIDDFMDEHIINDKGEIVPRIRIIK